MVNTIKWKYVNYKFSYNENVREIFNYETVSMYFDNTFIDHKKL